MPSVTLNLTMPTVPPDWEDYGAGWTRPTVTPGGTVPAPVITNSSLTFSSTYSVQLVHGTAWPHSSILFVENYVNMAGINYSAQQIWANANGEWAALYYFPNTNGVTTRLRVLQRSVPSTQDILSAEEITFTLNDVSDTLIPTVPAREGGTGPRVLLTAADLANRRARYLDYDTGGSGGPFATEATCFWDWRLTYYTVKIIKGVLAPDSETYTGTDPVGAHNGSGDAMSDSSYANMTFTAVPWWRRGLHEAWHRIRMNNLKADQVPEYDGLYYEIMANAYWAAAVAYDWLYPRLSTTNPVTGNSYGADLRTEFARGAELVDMSGWPGSDPDTVLMPPPAGLYAGRHFTQPPVANGHQAHAPFLSNLLTVGLAIYDEDPTVWDATTKVVRSRFRDLMQWTGGSEHPNHGLYYNRLDDFEYGALLLKRIGVTDLLPAGYSKAWDAFIYAMRPDGKHERRGDYTSDALRATHLRRTAWMHGLLYEGTDEGTRASYWAELDRIDVDGTLETAVLKELHRYMEGEDTGNGAAYPVKFILTSDSAKQDVIDYAADKRGDFPTKPHPIFDGIPLIKYSPSPAHHLAHRSDWNFGELHNAAGANKTFIAWLNGQERYHQSHEGLEVGSYQIYYRGPLVSLGKVYQGDAGHSWFGGIYYNMWHQEGISGPCITILDPLDYSTTRSPSMWLSGGPKIPPASSDQPGDMNYILDDGLGYKGYRLSTNIGRYAAPDDAVGYVAIDMTLAYRSPRSDRADLVTRRMLSVVTGQASCPGVVVVADHIDANDEAMEKASWVPVISTPTLSGRRAWWENSETPGMTNPTNRLRTDPNSLYSTNLWGYYDQFRGSKSTPPGNVPGGTLSVDWTGGYYGRLTTDWLFPLSGASLQYIHHPPSAYQYDGTDYEADLDENDEPRFPVTRLAVLERNASGSRAHQYLEAGDANPPDKRDANGEGTPRGRFKWMTTGGAADSLIVHCTTDAGVAAPSVTVIDATGVMGARVATTNPIVALFAKGGGEIAATTPSITLTGSNNHVLASVVAGTWEVRIDGAIQGSQIVVDATTRLLRKTGVPAGGLTLVLI